MILNEFYLKILKFESSFFPAWFIISLKIQNFDFATPSKNLCLVIESISRREIVYSWIEREGLSLAFKFTASSNETRFLHQKTKSWKRFPGYKIYKRSERPSFSHCKLHRNRQPGCANWSRHHWLTYTHQQVASLVVRRGPMSNEVSDAGFVISQVQEFAARRLRLEEPLRLPLVMSGKFIWHLFKLSSQGLILLAGKRVKVWAFWKARAWKQKHA